MLSHFPLLGFGLKTELWNVKTVRVSQCPGECDVCADANLEGFLSCVNQLVTFEFGALDERLAALGADVHARAVGVEMLPHGGVIPEHLCAALGTTDRAAPCWQTVFTCFFIHKYKCQASPACLWFPLIRFKSWQVEPCVPEMVMYCYRFHTLMTGC